MTAGPSQPATGEFEPYDAATLLIHLLLAAFGASRRSSPGSSPATTGARCTPGFDVHSWIGTRMGAVVAHAMAGESIWRRMFPWSESGAPRA